MKKIIFLFLPFLLFGSVNEANIYLKASKVDKIYYNAIHIVNKKYTFVKIHKKLLYQFSFVSPRVLKKITSWHLSNVGRILSTRLTSKFPVYKIKRFYTKHQNYNLEVFYEIVALWDIQNLMEKLLTKDIKNDFDGRKTFLAKQNAQLVKDSLAYLLGFALKDLNKFQLDEILRYYKSDIGQKEIQTINKALLNGSI